LQAANTTTERTPKNWAISNVVQKVGKMKTDEISIIDQFNGASQHRRRRRAKDDGLV